ncbi:hypothetical protein [Vibrio owensii]|uniref:hypothetical protein n=1 Tax=Vibrio harveyi group TaxID=717610 RepID=UPI003CC6B6EC
MSVYISHTLNRFAILNISKDGKEGWELFDKAEEQLKEVAAKFGLHLSRDSVNESLNAMTIHNTKPNYNCFYGYECFEYDMSVSEDDTFIERSDAFINELKSLPEFEEFNPLEFNEPANRYFVIT